MRTKLFIPRAHPDLVARPWLSNRLDEGLRSKLTLISAPAGFGKTTLLSTWISHQETGKFCWVSLDTGDNDPSRFWGYFIAALQTIQPQVGKTALAMLQAPQPPGMDVILTEILNDIALIKDDFFVVLDDYHVIENEGIHLAINYFLEHQPPHIHLLIASRVEPPLPLHLMRVRRELLEFNLADLRFSNSEAATFLNRVMKLNLKPADINTLENITEGWAAGLQLAALSLQGIEDVHGFLQSFTGSHRYIFDYLAQEVLNRQPPHVQRFLLQTSILERMNASLCDAVLGPDLNTQTLPGTPASQAILEHLEHTNLFIVPLDQHRQWYRYHHLFSDFLRARLERTASNEEIHQYHSRASRWLEQHKLVGEALTHALAAKQPEQAARLLGDAATDMFNRSELVTLKKWIQALPDHLIRNNPRLSMIYAWAYLATAEGDTVESYLQDIERVIGAKADGSFQSMQLPPETRGALAEISNLRTSLAFNRMDFQASAAFCKQASEYLSDDVQAGFFHDRKALLSVCSFNTGVVNELYGNVPEALNAFNETIHLSSVDRNDHLLPMAISHQGALLVVQGKLKQAYALYEDARRMVDATEKPSPLSGMVYTGLGSLLYEWGALSEAESNLMRGIELGRTWSSWESITGGYLGLVRCKSAHGDLQAALILVDELDRLCQQLNFPWASGVIQSQQALLHALAGQKETASRWADGMLDSLHAGIPYPAEAEALTLARVLLYLQRVAEAADLLEKLTLNAETGQRWGRVITGTALLSLALAGLGQTRQALFQLQRSLTLAEPEGYRRTYLDEGLPMRQLLSQLQTGSPGANRPYLKGLLEERSSRGQTHPHPITEGTSPQHPVSELSVRELEVLKLMALGATNQQIASKLYITLNTVKTHIKNILGHLEVENRTRAVARARELGILD